MRGSVIVTIIIVGALVVAAVTNPTIADFRQYAKEHSAQSGQSAIATLANNLTGADGTAVDRANYIFFSIYTIDREDEPDPVVVGLYDQFVAVNQ